MLPKYLKYSTFSVLGMIVLWFPLPFIVIRIRSNVVCSIRWGEYACKVT
jgi:hypothetical protein